jgi:selenocysteine lyase/cysteine desulfurase
VAAHEEELIAYTLEQLARIPGVHVYGQCDPARANEKVGAIPFNMDGVSHFLLAAILGYEGGIGVRSGCFCAHPYVVHLLDLDEATASSWRDQMLRGDKSNMPGMVRASFGCYNGVEDVDRLLEMLDRVARVDYQGDYRLTPGTGEYYPVGHKDSLSEHFQIMVPDIK